MHSKSFQIIIVKNKLSARKGVDLMKTRQIFILAITVILMFVLNGCSNSNGYFGLNSDNNMHYKYSPMDGTKTVSFTENGVKSLSFTAEMSSSGSVKVYTKDSQGKNLSSVDIKEGKNSYKLDLSDLKGTRVSFIVDGKAKSLDIWLDTSKIKMDASNAKEKEKVKPSEPAKSKKDGGGFHIWPFF